MAAEHCDVAIIGAEQASRAGSGARITMIDVPSASVAGTSSLSTWRWRHGNCKFRNGRDDMDAQYEFPPPTGGYS